MKQFIFSRFCSVNLQETETMKRMFSLIPCETSCFDFADDCRVGNIG